MSDLVKRVASRASARWQYLTFDPLRTWAVPGAAACKRDCPNLERRGTKLGQLHPHFSISTYRGGLARSVAGLNLRPLGKCAHVHEVAISRSTSGPRPDCPMAQPGIWEFGGHRWP